MNEDKPYKQKLVSQKAQVWVLQPMSQFETREGKKYRVEKNGELRWVRA